MDKIRKDLDSYKKKNAALQKSLSNKYPPQATPAVATTQQQKGSYQDGSWSGKGQGVPVAKPT